VRVVGTQKQFTEGSLQITEQPLDVAINGRGFFEVTLPDGSSAYTRNGEFHMDANGQMVTAGGLVIQPGITVPSDARTITIGDDGTVSVVQANNATPSSLGNIQTVNFVNPAGLEAMGDNLFLETASSGNPQQGTPGLDGLGSLKQGALEASNVDVVEELVNMITTQRAYEMNSKVLSTADQMLQFITNNV